jgi:ABC-2 type transport system permease protein
VKNSLLSWLVFSPIVVSGWRRLETKDKRLRLVIFLGLGALLWAGTFWGLWRVLTYFRGIESFGDLLAWRLLDMVFLTFLGLLIFSNVVSGFSAFYLSQDLELLFSLPVPIGSLYRAKLSETLVASSWMVLFFGTPVFLVYGVVYEAPWEYYGLLVLGIIPFLVIPGCVGVALVMTLARVFRAKRARDAMMAFAITCGVGMYLLLRFLQPERLADPETFSGVLGYLVSLNAPRHPLLPSNWMVQVVAPSLFRRPGEEVFFLAMLWSTASAFVVMGTWWAQAVYASGWSKAQEGKGARGRPWGFIETLVEKASGIFPQNMRPFVVKDAVSFFRDASQWSQLLLLGALVIVYLYNFAAMPLEKAPIDSWYLKNLMAFLNLGLAGFVVAAVAVRFVFPAVSLERGAFWLVKSSPLDLKSFLWAKFWASVVPLVVLSELLVVISNALLKVSPFMMVLSSCTIFLASFGLTGLGVGMGAMYPRFKVENVANISSGMGGLLYMILAVGFMGAMVVLEGLPVYIFFYSRFSGQDPGPWAYLLAGLCLAAVFLLMILAFWYPMKRGAQALEEYEI